MSLFHKDILALDWDHRQLRAVSGRVSKGKAVVRRMFQEPLPSDVTGEDPAVFGRWLAKVLAKNRCSATRTLMAIPRDQVVLKTLLVPSQTPQVEIASLVQFQMQKELPFAVEEAVIDYTVAGEPAGGVPADVPAEPPTSPPAGSAGPAAPAAPAAHASHPGLAGHAGHAPPAAPAKNGQSKAPPSAPHEYLVAATRREVINYYQAVAQAAELDLAHLGLRCFSNLQTVHACAPNDFTRRLLLVNVGPELSEIDIIRGGSLLFSRSASVPLNERDDPTDFLNRLTLEVIRSVQAARAAVADLELDGTMVAAPGWLAASIAERLGQRLDVRGRVLEPGRGITLPPEHRQGAGDFSAALGLILGETRGAALPFDFIHPHKPVDLVARRQQRRRLTGIAAAGAVAVLFAGNLAGQAIYDMKVDEPERAEEKTRVAEADKVNAFGEEIDNLRKLQRRAPDWLAEYKKINDLWVNPFVDLDSAIANARNFGLSDAQKGKLEVLLKDFREKARKPGDGHGDAKAAKELTDTLVENVKKTVGDEARWDRLKDSIVKPPLNRQAFNNTYHGELTRKGWEIRLVGAGTDAKTDTEIRRRLREIYPKPQYEVDPQPKNTQGAAFDIVVRYLAAAGPGR